MYIMYTYISVIFKLNDAKLNVCKCGEILNIEYMEYQGTDELMENNGKKHVKLMGHDGKNTRTHDGNMIGNMIGMLET